jgi:hypothetical protein
MLTPAGSVRPRMRLGVTIAEAWGSGDDKKQGSGAAAVGQGPGASELAEWVGLYKAEQYLLTWRDGAAWVVVKRDAAPLALLQAVWQAAWLDAATSSSNAAGNGGGSSGAADFGLLKESLAAARRHYPGFLAAMESAGWDLTAPPVLQMQQTRVVVEGE